MLALRNAVLAWVVNLGVIVLSRHTLKGVGQHWEADDADLEAQEGPGFVDVGYLASKVKAKSDGFDQLLAIEKRRTSLLSCCRIPDSTK